jgi:hypothetical protein
MPELVKNSKSLDFNFMRKQHFSLQTRNDLLAAYPESGLSIKAYAAAHGIGYSTIQRWLRDYNRSRATGNSSASPTFRTHGYSEPIDFMDITRPLMRTIPSMPKDSSYDADVSKSNDVISRISATQPDHDASLTAASDEKRSPLCAPPLCADSLCDRLDICLPNGIRMTLHRTSFDASVILIKSLV